MHRIFGKKKEEAPSVNINDVGTKVGGRVDNLDTKIAKLEVELKGFKDKIAKTRPGAAQQNLKKRALQVLKRKKMYEQQRDNLSAQSFNIEQASFAIDTAKDTMDTVSAMKSATAQLKVEHKKINIDEIEDVQDDMADMLEDMNEIQEVMGRSYGIGDDIDESELEAELEGLEDEWEAETSADAEPSIPSYLTPAAATQQPSLPSALIGESAAASEKRQGVDEYGLPVALQ